MKAIVTKLLATAFCAVCEDSEPAALAGWGYWGADNALVCPACIEGGLDCGAISESDIRPAGGAQ